VTVPAPELLERLAVTLRNEIGPAVEEAYPRTQAFMAAVVLEKLARQVALAAEHERANAAEMAQLFADLDATLPAGPTPRVVRAIVEEGVAHGDSDVLCRMIEALYRYQADLGRPAFDTSLQRVRTTLRARIDRQMEYAA
jgi:hypothetical protein